MTRLVTRSGARRLDENMDALGRPRAALGVADDPAHGVAGGDRTGADQLLAGCQRDVGDLAGRGIDLIERAIGVGIDLHGVDVARARRLHARRAIGLLHPRVRIGWLGGAPSAPEAASAGPASGKGLGSSTIWTGLGGSGCSTACRGVSSYLISGGFQALEQARERDRGKQRGGKEGNTHQPSSLDQLKAWT